MAKVSGRLLLAPISRSPGGSSKVGRDKEPSLRKNLGCKPKRMSLSTETDKFLKNVAQVMQKQFLLKTL